MKPAPQPSPARLPNRLGHAALLGLILPAGALSLAAASSAAPQLGAPWWHIVTPQTLVLAMVLLVLSALCSAGSQAYFSLHRLQLQVMKDRHGFAGNLVYRLMQHPGNLLTTLLITSCILDVLFVVVTAAPVEAFFEIGLQWPTTLSYIVAGLLVASVLLFFGELLPKRMVAHSAEPFARFVAAPVFVLDRTLEPLRSAIMAFTTVIFRVTGITERNPVPFVTDEEFFSMLSENEAAGTIEQDERVMIQGIIQFSEVTVRELKTPRRDIIAVSVGATVSEALDVVRQHQYSRIPVIGESVDQIRGILFAKDLLPLAEEERLEDRIRPLIRKAHFVPESMSVAQFVRTAQKSRTHMAIVVDEYGGTEGIITLEDALREVVGSIGEPHDTTSQTIIRVTENELLLDGSVTLDELECATGLALKSENHETLCGFLMEQLERLLNTGDEVAYQGARFQVLEMDGRRASRVRMLLPETAQEMPGPDAAVRQLAESLPTALPEPEAETVER